MQGIVMDPDLNDDLRRESVYSGNLLLYSKRAASVALCEHARRMSVEALAPHSPEQAQFAMSVEEFVVRVGPLKTRFTNDLETKRLVRALLQDLGCDLQRTFFDVPRLRVVPSGGYLSSGVSYAYKAHRDVWYSSPACQLNYWMPVFPVVPGRAMSFFPAYWERALSNSSNDFDYDEWRAVGRRQAVSQIGQDNRKHPLPLEPVDVTSELRIAGNEGAMIVFSANHLHATAPNETGVTRFSLDFRTLDLDDYRQGKGARNTDGRARGTTIGDFLRADDFSAITAAESHPEGNAHAS